MAIEQWGFFSMLHLLWHGAFVYNGHLRGPLTLASIAERLEVEENTPTNCAHNVYECLENNTARTQETSSKIVIIFFLIKTRIYKMEIQI